MGYDYTISKANAVQDAWANPATLTDPVQYTTEPTARLTAKYYGKPVLEEVLALIGSRVSSRAYQKTWTCLAGLNVGDPVYVSATDTVSLALATTAATSRVIGFVRYKPSTITCYIDHFILKTGLSGLTAGSPVYLSDAGGFAATAGTISKVLGIATDTDEAIVEADQGGAEIGALSGTTANTFTIDSDSVTGKIIIDVALGATDKSLTLTNAALTGNRVITFPDLTGTVVLADAGNVVFNEDGADYDFRIEGVGVTHALFVQGSDGFIGIGCTPRFRVDILGIAGSIPLNMVGVCDTTAYVTTRLSGGGSGYGTQIQFTDDVNYNFCIGTYNDTTGDFTFNAGRVTGNAGTEVVRIKQSGYVGIGCAPRYKYEIRATAGTYFNAASSSSVAHGMTDLFPTDVFHAHMLHSSLGNSVFYLSGGDLIRFLGTRFLAPITQRIQLQPGRSYVARKVEQEWTP